MEGRTRRGLTLSLAAHDPDGLGESAKRTKAQLECVPARKYRLRRRNDLTAAEQQQIVDSYVKEYIPQKEVARRFRVTPLLVSNLVTDSKKRPEKLREVKAREKLQVTQLEAIQSAVDGLRQQD